MFPTPASDAETATLMGGWMFGIPETSQNKDLAWEFLVSMLEPEHIAEFAKDGYLPTQVPVGEGRYSGNLRETIPYYDSMISMLAIGHQRPNIPEYPQIAEHIRQAIDQVYYGEKSPKEALDEAAQKSAVALGWDS
jgi:multiple sugar transport system substrate-binding protein